MTNARALIATALLVVLTGGNPLRGDDKPAEIDRLKKELADGEETDRLAGRMPI